MLNDGHTGILSELLLHGWPLTKTEMQKDLQSYWLFRDEIKIIHVIAMEGRRKKYM